MREGCAWCSGASRGGGRAGIWCCPIFVMMATRSEINVHRESTVPGAQSAGKTRTELPQDLLAQSARRLGIACLVWVALWSLGYLLNNFVAPAISPGKPLDDAWPWPGNAVALAVVVVSLAVFTATRRGWIHGTRALDLGLWYEMVIALAIGIVNQWTPNTTGLSWICVLIVTFPAIVPNTPRKTLLAALAAASMDPLGLALTWARGVAMPEASAFVWAHIPNYICALLAILPARVITRLGQQVTRARRLGSYQLGELLARGGMGEVYRARHRLLARPAAIKLIRPEVLGAGSPQAAQALAERFRREARAAALLRSPHTIDLYDFGLADDGTMFYVMELLDGLDLERLVQRHGPLPEARAIHLLRQACRSLEEAHARGLVHRDIKPSNIQTCRLGLEVDFVKVLDFGLVRQEGPAQDTGLSAPGTVVGTPAFLAPEVALGAPADRRADLYSLGCVAYWLLTGRFVFADATPVEMVIRHVNEAPEPPSRRAELPLSPELDAVVLACLAKRPDERPVDAADVASRLAACPGSALWTDEQAHRWWDLHLPQAPPTAGGILEPQLLPGTSFRN